MSLNGLLLRWFDVRNAEVASSILAPSTKFPSFRPDSMSCVTVRAAGSTGAEVATDTAGRSITPGIDFGFREALAID